MELYPEHITPTTYKYKIADLDKMIEEMETGKIMDIMTPVQAETKRGGGIFGWTLEASLMALYFFLLV